MDTDKTPLKIFLSSLVMIIVVELVSGKVFKIAGLYHVPLPPLVAVGFVRSLEIVFMLALVYFISRDRSAIGLGLIHFASGFKIGVFWSIGFGILTAVVFGCLYFAGIHPLKMVTAPLPEDMMGLILLFVVGGVVGPIAEELFFRGICYGYFRKWGILSAIIITTGIFVVAHSIKNNVPVPQIVGGVVFALSYEYSKSLVSPIIIHIAGNLAIFSISALA